MCGYGGWGWGSWIFTAIVLTALFAGVITAIVVAMRPQHRPGPGLRPEEILAERFARGEIDDENYRGRIAALREHQ